MDTLQIQHALQDVNSFLGVYASDLLPLSIAQTGTIIVNTDPHTAWLTLASHIFSKPTSHLKRVLFRFLYIFSKPTSHLKRVLFRFLWPLSFYSLHPRFHTAPLYCLAIQQNTIPRTYHYCLWWILLPFRSIHGQGLHPATVCGPVCCW